MGACKQWDTILPGWKSVRWKSKGPVTDRESKGQIREQTHLFIKYLLSAFSVNVGGWETKEAHSSVIFQIPESDCVSALLKTH